MERKAGAGRRMLGGRRHERGSLRLHRRRRRLGRLRARQSAEPRSRAIACSSSRPAGATTGSGFIFPSATFTRSAIRAPTGCSRPRPCRALGGRSIAYPRGRVVGGSSAINAMIYMRGQAADYDGWRQLGLAGWGWDDVLPYFIRQEDHHGGLSALHGAGGEWRVERPRVSWPILDAVREAGVEIGIPKIDDFNRGDNEGSAYFEVNQRRGRRWSAARGFLKPILKRPNLRLATGAHVERILFEGRRATGLRYSQRRPEPRGASEGRGHSRGRRDRLAAAPGAFGRRQAGCSPGDRRPRRPRAAGGRRKPAGPSAAAARFSRVEGARTLNVDLSVAIQAGDDGARLCASPARADDHGALAARPVRQVLARLRHRQYRIPCPAAVARPVRRADARLSGDNDQRLQPAAGEPRLEPRCERRSARRARDPAQLSVGSGRSAGGRGLRSVLRAVLPRRARLRATRRESSSLAHDLQDDDELVEAAGEIGTTIFHPVGTAKMGSAQDPAAVVDERLRVYGLGGLRVADASVMPRITSGNTGSPTMMIAEKAAEMILADARAA